MEILCPECMSVLHPTSPTSASCPACREQYEILFPVAAPDNRSVGTPQQSQGIPLVMTTDQIPPELPEMILVRCPQCTKQFQVPFSSAGKQGKCTCGQVFTLEASASQVEVFVASCANHPAVSAFATCGTCGKAICQTCAFTQPNGTVCCPSCVTSASIPPASRAAAALSAMAGGVSYLATAPPGSRCQRHPESAAVHLCENCRAPICATCDFSFSGGIHLCPTCAVTPSQGLTGNRKTLVGVAFALATWATIGIAILFSGWAQTAGEAAVTVLGMAVAIPAIIGGGVGIACFERRLGNPPVVWVAAIWNIILLTMTVLLAIVGSLK